jgi:hypothetical protein
MMFLFTLFRRMLGIQDVEEDMDVMLLMNQSEEAIQLKQEEEERRKRAKILLFAALDYLQKKGRGRSTQFCDLLNLEGMWRRDRRIPREALLDLQSLA